MKRMIDLSIALQIFDLNVKSGLFLVQEAAPYMEKRG